MVGVRVFLVGGHFVAVEVCISFVECLKYDDWYSTLIAWCLGGELDLSIQMRAYALLLASLLRQHGA